MTRALFHYSLLHVGGAEKSSLRLLQALVERGWDITLVLTTGGGALEHEVDPRIRLVRLRPGAYGLRFMAAKGPLGRLFAIPDLAAYCLARVIGCIRMLPFLFQRYDMAATLLQGTSSWFCRRMVRAKVRVHWIRSDLQGADKKGHLAARLRRSAFEIDHFVCVSEVTRASFAAAVPEAAHKACVIYNVLNANDMLVRAREGTDPFPPRADGELRILTVCRLFESAKGLRRMARVCARLRDHGFNFRWFVVGDGPDQSLLEREIDDLGLRNSMILMGRMANPFPAYMNADIVAMLSQYEGLCGVVNEAKVVGRPVVATRVSGIEEQLVDHRTGLIVANDEDAIVEGMRLILSDRSLREALANSHLPPALCDDAAKVQRLEEMLAGKDDTCE
ncbi:glycosyltransferase [Ramlibacter sp. USB13]|uniref:Glycosyltransferase n=1 Tax=Ramlibacter cellulosilyticus TaxID=2764187 RepID=A0A923SCE6_9BURK|nr:glycosyltransferase [Ramlibacter cellulosilyticus]MBC5784870.1 glycosyltransferase [Ramlibacter cellulosilyticus]